MPNAADGSVLASASFHVSAADITASNRKHMRWTLRRPQTWLFLAAISLVAVVAFAAAIPHATAGALAAAAIGAAVWMIGWALIVYALQSLFARRTFGKQPNLRHLWRVDLNERGVRGVTPNQDAFVAWGDYVAWSEDEKIFLLYIGDRLFQIVPKQGVDANFIETLRRLVAHLPQR